MALPKRNYILGISSFYHDSAAVLLVDGVIVAAAQEERFTRKKHDDAFPTNAIRYVLSEYGLKPSDLSVVAFYDKPLLKFERLLEIHHRYVPRGLSIFLKAMPVWIKEKLFTRRLIKKGLEEIEGAPLSKWPRILFTEHHLSHAASAFYPSRFTDAAILTIDGVGEWSTTVIGHGEGASISLIKEMQFPHSLGLLYSAFTYYCGFKINSGEYKLMGLAPYGHKNSPRVEEYKEKILGEIIDLKEDGSLFLQMAYFSFTTELRTVHDAQWHTLFGIPPRTPETPLTQEYMDLALAIQEITEEVVVRLARTAKEETGSKNLVLAGGVALNCVANARIVQSGLFEQVYIQPAAGDAGGALGAALAVHYIWQKHERVIDATSYDSMSGSYLGPEYSDIDVRILSQTYSAPCIHHSSFDELTEKVAGFIAEGNVIGWFQGRMEWGPRALGNRSIIADPRNVEMQKKLNLKIKYREGFRPFAPSVLEEDVSEYFATSQPSPYMLLTAPVVPERRKPKADDTRPLAERLNTPRSDIPSVTHLDYSARLQTVSRKTNKRYWDLIAAFKKKTRYGLIVNTSFNVRGEPIVMTPTDAYRCFMNTEMDYLVIGNTIFDKKLQPAWARVAPEAQYGLD
jgi:carbamoyltransferase